MFTRLSVHWAESMTATSNWYSFSKCSSLSAIGMFSSNHARAFSYRSLVFIIVSGFVIWDSGFENRDSGIGDYCSL